MGADELLAALGVSTRALGGVLRRRAEPDADVGAVAHLRSVPGTVVWGTLPGPRPAVLSVADGAVVDVDTVSHHLMCEDAPPVAAFGALGVAADEVLDDVVRIHAEVERPAGASPHVLTGPIAIAGAAPGDVLEVAVVAADVRVPYGISRSRPGAGVLPELLDEVVVRLARLDADETTLRLAPLGRLPLAPFPGFVAVTPPGDADPDDAPGRPRSARGLGRWGGNLDLRHLTAGSSLFLPVQVPNALLYVGDPHGAQGDGEISGTAIEQSCTFRLRLIVHRDVALSGPVAATPTHWLATGIHEDLDEAVRRATAAAVDLLVGLTDGALSAAEAYGLCGAGVDLRIAEAVNGRCLAYAAIPRSLLA